MSKLSVLYICLCYCRCKCSRICLNEMACPIVLFCCRYKCSRMCLNQLAFDTCFCCCRCKCAKNENNTCLNRVAQQPLQLKLQVFKTVNRGWGIRCLNDIPQGGFICIYAGRLLTEQGANEVTPCLSDGLSCFTIELHPFCFIAAARCNDFSLMKA